LNSRLFVVVAGMTNHYTDSPNNPCTLLCLYTVARKGHERNSFLSRATVLIKEVQLDICCLFLQLVTFELHSMHMTSV